MSQNEQLQNYISQAREAGMADEEIERNLLEAGWTKKMLKEAIGGTISMVSLIRKINKKAILVIIIVAAIIVIGVSGYFIFQKPAFKSL